MIIKYSLRMATFVILVIAIIASTRPSQAKFQLIMSGYNTPSAATPTPLGCQTFTNTNNGNVAVQVGATCLPQTSCPATDAFPHDPASFLSPTTSCTTNGSGECSAAISQAIAAGVAQGGHGDIKFNTPGTYLVNLTAGGTYVNSGGITPPANETFICAVPGVTLKTTLQSGGHTVGILSLKNGHNTVCGCDFQGGQTGSPPFNLNPAGSGGNFLIQVSDNAAVGDLIEGNTFERQFGNSAIQFNITGAPTTLGPGSAPSPEVVKFNSFTLGPLYAVNEDAQVNVIDENNFIQDEWDGPEWDACPGGGSVGTVKVQNDMIVTNVGYCFQAGNTNCSGDALQGPGYIAVGTGPTSAGTCSYSGVTVGGSAALANYCSGTPTISAGYGHTTNGNAFGTNGTATVSGNVVGPSCICHNTSSC